MINWIINLFRSKSIFEKLNIISVDKKGCGWYNLYDSDANIYEFYFDGQEVDLYDGRILIYSTHDAFAATDLYLKVRKLPRIEEHK